MAETLTANFSWTKPDPGASANTWGATLNADFDKIDAQVFANQTAINAGQVPIGSISMFGGATPPANWLICDGSSLSTAAPYDKLFAVLQYAHGGSGANFNLPNLQGVFPLGVGPSNALATTGGAATVTLAATMIPAHSHSVAITETPHTHTASSPAHTHAMTDHTHTVNQVFGGGSDMQSGSGWGQRNQAGGAMTSIPNVGATTAGITVNSANSGVSITGNATGVIGGGLSHNNMPPYVALSFIVRYQ